MNVLDFILIGLILLFGVWGLRKGFLETLGALVGIIVAAVIAGRFYLFVGDFFGSTDFANIIAFVIIFAITIKLVGLFFWLLGKVFKIISILPFVQSFDRFLGAILGLVAGILILTVLTYFLSKYNFNSWLIWQMKDSILVAVLLKISYIFMPLLPDALKKIKSLI